MNKHTSWLEPKAGDHGVHGSDDEGEGDESESGDEWAGGSGARSGSSALSALSRHAGAQITRAGGVAIGKLPSDELRVKRRTDANVAGRSNAVVQARRPAAPARCA
eukprot:SAG11_NODE_5300_length_1602_cov_2.236194_2_plen_106_part_00